MEERVDELGSESEETGHIVLQRGVDVVVFIGSELEILLQL